MSPLSSLATLSGLTLICAGFTIGLTFAPCYSSLCSEEFFPLETRIHMAIYFVLLISLIMIFFLRARITALQNISKKPIIQKRIPWLGAKITYGGLFIVIWILFLDLVTTALWIQVKPFWNRQLLAFPDWRAASTATTVTSIIGHHIDIILGLVIIPVPRHSAICEAFGFPSSTLLWAHKALAYLLLIGTIAHFAAYMAFVHSWAMNSIAVQSTASILNPYFGSASTARLGGYSLANFPTGLVSFALLIIITITALGQIRRRHYELFYYIHVTMGIVFLITTCLHASTSFYCLVPGLLLWTYDIAWRFFGGAGLARQRLATIETAENGWIRLSVVPTTKETSEVDKKGQTKGGLHPLSTYYLNLPAASRLECHPMSATTARGHGDQAQFLFSECLSTDKKTQWTRKIGKLASLEKNQAVVKLEGPYTPSIPALDNASHIVCIVGGTGITGAISIADWWAHDHSSAKNLTTIWTVREAATAHLREWMELQQLATRRPELQLSLHITSKLGRLDLAGSIKGAIDGVQQDGSSWVYISGPEGLLDSGEDACSQVKKELKDAGSSKTLDWYAARWEL